jgi:beta-galactosidase
MTSLQIRIPVVLAVLIACSVPASMSAARVESPRQIVAADASWKFYLGDPGGAEMRTFADGAWRAVDLPHDWSIESKPDKDNSSGSGEGYFPEGIGWYRKTFHALSSWRGKRVTVEFDGVYQNATVYLNGHKLGTHPNGYTSFAFDLTPDLDFSDSNVLAVRVDNSEQPNSRWYSGSGIFRHVRVFVTDPVHLEHWGIFVSTPKVTDSLATVSVRTRVANESADVAQRTVETTLLDSAGKKIGSAQSKVSVTPGKTEESAQEITVANPLLWSPGSPTLYHAVSTIRMDGRIVDLVTTPFGIRTLAWSVENGLLLNGKALKLAGGSVHDDNGPLGAAAFDRAEERKAELLKAAGFNAVRTAHNPPSPAFLDACDRIGLLVLDEPFDVWTVSKRKYDYGQYFHDWWQRDVDSMILRDRNHPSIILWGIGNEIPEVWTAEGAPIAKEIAERVRSLDSTRPLTQAFPGATFGPNPDAAIAQVDIAGYNYNLAQNQAEDHRRVPGRIMMTTESFSADAFEQWKLVHDNPYILGEFVWTAMDYLGESGIGAWSYGEPKQAAQSIQLKNFLRKYMATMGKDGKNPMAPFQNGQPPSPTSPGYPWHAAYCGDLDLTGFRKPWSFYRDILWNGGDRVFATVLLPEPEGKKIVAMAWAVYPSLPSWTWSGQEGKRLTVEVYSGAERVQLYLNDKLIGEKPTGLEQEFKALFDVPYEPGTLRAIGLRNGHKIAESVLTTTGEAAKLRIVADRTALQADGQDLSFVAVEVVDAKGRPDLHADQEVQFEISGPGEIAAVGNGDGHDPDSYHSDRCKLFEGRALVVIRSSRAAGRIELRVHGSGLNSDLVTIDSKAPQSSTRLY